MQVNPGNGKFLRSVNDFYVDKTNFISFINSRFEKDKFGVCFARPRRFGKSITANMLCAYYSKGCDSKAIFDKFEISKDKDYLTHLNKHNVLYFDMQHYGRNDETGEHFIESLHKSVVNGLKKEFPEAFEGSDIKYLQDAIDLVHQKLGETFILVIDEWDYLFRNYPENRKVQKNFMALLQNLFKDGQTYEAFDLVYMTGIFPIKRYDTQSNLNMFAEFNFTNTGGLGQYFGLTTDEVKTLCVEHDLDFSKTKFWYDGYRLDGFDIYNPNAIVELILHKIFDNYWTKTSSMEPIYDCIGRNFDGVKECVIDLVAGSYLHNIEISSSNLEPSSFTCKDDILAYMIHLGYLAYDRDTDSVYVPNYEVKESLIKALNKLKWPLYEASLKRSDILLEATLNKECDTVASMVADLHNKYSSFFDYSTESCLKHAVVLGYLSALKFYEEPRLELKGGLGFADVGFRPSTKHATGLPALIIEFQKDKSAEIALDQIESKGYIEAVKGYASSALLIGISFDGKTKEHQCVIKEIEIQFFFKLQNCN